MPYADAGRIYEIPGSGARDLTTRGTEDSVSFTFTLVSHGVKWPT